MIAEAFKDAELAFFKVKDNNIDYIGNSFDSSFDREEKILLLLDYDKYLNLDKYLKSINEKSITTENIFSPCEAIAGYLKYHLGYNDGCIQILDFSKEYVYSYEIEFLEGRYNLKGQKILKQSLSILFESNFKIDISNISKLQSFLDEEYDDKTTFNEIIRSAVIEYQKGDESYENIFSILDNPNWKDIGVSDIIKFKKELFDTLNIDVSKNIFITGGIGSILNDEKSINTKSLKLEGIKSLCLNNDEFHANLLYDITVEIYCHPSLIQLPVFRNDEIFKNYIIPQKAKIVDTGELTLLKGSERHLIKTNTKTLKQTELNIFLDGNQKIIIQTESNTYFI